jgi:hypothetical protein
VTEQAYNYKKKEMDERPLIQSLMFLLGYDHDLTLVALVSTPVPGLDRNSISVREAHLLNHQDRVRMIPEASESTKSVRSE